MAETAENRQNPQWEGALDVLRNGVKDSGCKFRLAYFRPASGLNDVGKYASLAVDESTGPTRGLMRIAYQDATATDLLYITEQP